MGFFHAMSMKDASCETAVCPRQGYLTEIHWGDTDAPRTHVSRFRHLYENNSRQNYIPGGTAQTQKAREDDNVTTTG